MYVYTFLNHSEGRQHEPAMKWITSVYLLALSSTILHNNVMYYTSQDTGDISRLMFFPLFSIIILSFK